MRFVDGAEQAGVTVDWDKATRRAWVTDCDEETWNALAYVAEHVSEDYDL
jgi:hypothetical protein